MPKTYRLSIYDAGSADEAPWNFESDQPFPPVQRGDLVNPQGKAGDYILRVVRVEHLIMNDGDSCSALVYTERVKDNAEARLA